MSHRFADDTCDLTQNRDDKPHGVCLIKKMLLNRPYISPLARKKKTANATYQSIKNRIGCSRGMKNLILIKPRINKFRFWPTAHLTHSVRTPSMPVVPSKQQNKFGFPKEHSAIFYNVILRTGGTVLVVYWRHFWARSKMR